MSLEIALFNKLKDVNLVSNRVYAVKAPQGVDKPYIVYSKVSNQREYSHDGFADLSRARMQVSCYADSYGSAKQVAEEVISTLEGWENVSFLVNEQDLYEEDTGIYHVPVDFFIWY